MRASALAECVQSDPSTVSRQVAALVTDGLLERRADPEDGRASLLVLTPSARTSSSPSRTRSAAGTSRTMLEDWSERDLRRFAASARPLHRRLRERQRVDTARIAARSAVDDPGSTD